MRYIVLVALLAMVLWVVARGSTGSFGKEETISYSKLTQDLDAGKVKSLEVDFRKGSGVAIMDDGKRIPFNVPQDPQLGDRLARYYPSVDLKLKNSSSSESMSVSHHAA